MIRRFIAKEKKERKKDDERVAKLGQFICVE